MTEKDLRAQREGEERVRQWQTSAQTRGLRGYFQRHDSLTPLWIEIRENLRRGPILFDQLWEARRVLGTT